jgi:hypothetical protein
MGWNRGWAVLERSVAISFAFFLLIVLRWFTGLPRGGYVALQLDPGETLRMAFYLQSRAAVLAVLGGTFSACVILLFVRGKTRAAPISLALCSVALLLPALSGQSNFLQAYRYPLFFGLLVGLALAFTLGVRLLQPLERRTSVLGKVPLALALAATAVAMVAILALAKHLVLYPALLWLFALWGSVAAAIALELVWTSKLGSLRWAKGGVRTIAVLCALSCVSGVFWTGESAAFAKVRFVFHRQRLGHDGLIRLASGWSTESSKVVAAFGTRSEVDRSVPPDALGNLSPKHRPHVILFVIDALRRDEVGAYVPEAEQWTPHVTRFAARALVHERAYSAGSDSASSTLSTLSGYPVGVIAQLDTIPLHLPAAFAHIGYDTATTWELSDLRIDLKFELLHGKKADDIGFSEVHRPNMDAKAEADRAQVDGLIERLGKATRPRMEAVHLLNTHGPFPGPNGRARYREAVKGADHEFGRLLTFLDERELWKDVILVVIGDHGEAFGEHGQIGHAQTLYVEETAVPFLLAAPGLAPSRDPDPMVLTELPWRLLRLIDLEWPFGDAGGKKGPAGRKGYILQENVSLGSLMIRVLRSADRAYHHFIAEDRRQVFDLTNDPREQQLDGDSDTDLDYGVDLEQEVIDWEERLVKEVRSHARRP